MKWSKELFLKVNERVGKRPWLDAFMIFCTKYLVFVLAALSLAWAVTSLYDSDPFAFRLYIKTMMTVAAFSFATSWGIALIVKKRRPVREMPHIKTLVTTIGTWKSFPSDHTIGSFIFALVTCISGAPIWFCAVLIILASLVSVSRIYVGVHYPRDIIGGILIATIYSSIALWLLDNITEPLFDIFAAIFR